MRTTLLNRLEDATRRVSQRLAASSTLLVAMEGPDDVEVYDRAGYSTWWVNVDGFVRLANDPDQRDRFLKVTADGPDPSVPRPIQLVVFTAEATAEFQLRTATDSLNLEPVVGLASRIAVLKSVAPFATADFGYRELSTDLLRIDDAQVVYSRTSVDDEVAVGSSADQIDSELREQEGADELLNARVELLRLQNYIGGLNSRVLRMQFDVDHFRHLAEKALTAEHVAAMKIRAIKRSRRYRLALLGVRPVDAVRKGKGLVAGGGSRARELEQ